jgi:hypothetical protein
MTIVWKKGKGKGKLKQYRRMELTENKRLVKGD